MNRTRPPLAIIPVALPAALLLAGAGGLGWSSIHRPNPVHLGTQPYRDSRLVGRVFPKRLLAPDGTNQVIPQPPRRIVSTVLAADEILTALVEPHRLAAVTQFADQPSLSSCATRVPPHARRIDRADAELILSLQPDLVVTADFTRASAVRLLTASGVPVLRLGRYHSFDQIIASIQTLAAAVGAPDHAQRITQTMRKRIADVEHRVRGLKRPRVLYWESGYTHGAGTLIDEMIELAGGHNTARELGAQGLTTLTPEMAAALEPQVILVRQFGPDEPASRDTRWLDFPAWRDSPAARTGRVYICRGPWLGSVSQFAVHGLEQVARLLHPRGFEP